MQCGPDEQAELKSWVAVRLIIAAYCSCGTSAERILARKMLLGYKFLTKNAPKIAPKCLSLDFVGPKKFPAKFPTKFPSKNQENYTDELLQARRENILLHTIAAKITTKNLFTKIMFRGN